VDSHHLPEGTHSLAPRPGSLGRLTFHGNRPRPPPRSRNRNRQFEDEDENDDEKEWNLVAPSRSEMAERSLPRDGMEAKAQ
jgi:ADP-heptose:LPS heptosyltransferase